MASAWGKSWSTFWGNSWGSIASAVQTVIGGAAPRRKVFLEYRNKAYWFDSEEELYLWLEAQEEDAIESLASLSVTIEEGKPVIHGKPKLIKVKSQDISVKNTVDSINRRIQSKFDQYRARLIEKHLLQLDEEEALILLVG